MLSMRSFRIITVVFIGIGSFFCARGNAQGALLMEEPYGIFGVLNPTGHNAIYFERICAETPVTLRRCQPGEMGVVIARYELSLIHISLTESRSEKARKSGKP